ncbi:MAG TPA: Hsp20/alpha crystallin family protein [Woeseiaceae bacterium]|nr:Hsp20/alpha crystallin family protein [Woeseiaceae bacterium]
MNVTRFEPWSLVNRLHRDLGLLDQFASRGFGFGQENGEQTVADWVPAIDILEEKERFVLRADLPGVNAEDIDISMDKGLLTISGERREEKSEQAEGLHRVERATGKFYRRFSLPETVNSDGISAKSVNGILEVSIPKQPQVQARRIAVEAA